ncbi:MAG: peptidoglycan editing factor PgeF [Methylococcaceae bacterium]|nr:peptidoglycan editing factor PgeF [Methylococcaceae bacterium]
MNGIKHWLTPDWPAPSDIYAATTLRTGGVSLPPYQSLNPAAHVGDNIDSVISNRQRISDMLNLPTDPFWLEQIHSNQVIEVNANSMRGQIADAAYTKDSGVVCAVMTADCLPLLVCSPDAKAIAAIHAGWRGLLSGIISNTLSAMHCDNYLVWLGPAIGPNCFEVGPEVRDAFVQKSTDFSYAFRSQQNGKWLADIYQLAKIELTGLGVTAIYGGNFCTVTDSQCFYSYRRDQQTGRMATLIWRA